MFGVNAPNCPHLCTSGVKVGSKDLIKPNPIKIGTLVKTIPRERHSHRAHVWRSAGNAQTNRKVKHVERCGLARVESVVYWIFNERRTAYEYGYLVDTRVSGVALLPLCAYFGRLHFLLQVKSAQKKPLPVNVSKLAAWGVRLGGSWFTDSCLTNLQNNGYFLRQTSIQKSNDNSNHS